MEIFPREKIKPPFSPGGSDYNLPHPKHGIAPPGPHELFKIVGGLNWDEEPLLVRNDEIFSFQKGIGISETVQAGDCVIGQVEPGRHGKDAVFPLRFIAKKAQGGDIRIGIDRAVIPVDILHGLPVGSVGGVQHLD
jgi:hypothetical protein